MKILTLLPLILFVNLSYAATRECIGSGLTAEMSDGIQLIKKDIKHDYTVTEFASDTNKFSLYVGFHPWVEKGPYSVKRFDLVSRYEHPLIVIHSGDDENDFLEIVMIVEREEYGKTCFLHLMAPNRGFNGRSDLTDFLLSVQYSPSDCSPELGGDILTGE